MSQQHPEQPLTGDPLGGPAPTPDADDVETEMPATDPDWSQSIAEQDPTEEEGEPADPGEAGR